MTKAEHLAKKVLNECGLTCPTELPLSEIILGRGAYYFERPLSGKEGEIVSLNGKSAITINSNIDFESKKRFVAAHELGHYEMHRDLLPIVFDTEYDLINWFKGGQQEKEANEFAAEFLMPSNLFYEECKGKIFEPKVIDHLSDVFKVSKTAAILNFLNKGNYPVCIVYCSNKKMRWWKTSEDFPYFLKFERDQIPPSGSVANELFTTDTNYFDDDRKQKIWKSTWFELQRDEQDKIMYEFCLHAISYNYTMSVIWED